MNLRVARSVVVCLALVGLLMACTNTPQPSSSGIWDQSTFENAQWN